MRTTLCLQVKECIKAAQAGKEYAVKAAKAPEDVVLHTKSEEDNGSGTAGSDSHLDLEDLALTTTPVVLPSTSISEEDSSQRKLISSTSGVGAFLGSRQGLACVVVMVLVVAVAIPRVVQNRRRARSGMRTE